jgi:hypothetical protein
MLEIITTIALILFFIIIANMPMVERSNKKIFFIYFSVIIIMLGFAGFIVLFLKSDYIKIFIFIVYASLLFSKLCKKLGG